MSSLREICLPNQTLVKMSRCSQSKRKIRQKITEKEEKSRKRQKTERGGRILACSGCYKPEGRDRKKKAEKE